MAKHIIFLQTGAMLEELCLEITEREVIISSDFDTTDGTDLSVLNAIETIADDLEKTAGFEWKLQKRKTPQGKKPDCIRIKCQLK